MRHSSHRPSLTTLVCQSSGSGRQSLSPLGFGTYAYVLCRNIPAWGRAPKYGDWRCLETNGSFVKPSNRIAFSSAGSSEDKGSREKISFLGFPPLVLIQSSVVVFVESIFVPILHHSPLAFIFRIKVNRHQSFSSTTTRNLSPCNSKPPPSPPLSLRLPPFLLSFKRAPPPPLLKPAVNPSWPETGR